MSEVESNGQVDEQPSVVSSSLGDRMRRRARQLEQRYTEVFPLPRFEDILGVELRAMGYEAMRKIGQRHQRVRNEALQELYIAADTVIAATESFFEFAGNERQSITTSWQRLAVDVKEVAGDVTPRQAIIALLGDTNVVFLFNDYQEWLRATRPDFEEEMSADFPETQSPS